MLKKSMLIGATLALACSIIAVSGFNNKLENHPQPALEAPVAENQDESYQRVYEAFSKLMQNTAQNSLSNVRRLVSRINQLVGTPAAESSTGTTNQQQQQQVTSSSSKTQTQTQVKASGEQQQQQQQQQQKQQQSLEDKTEQILSRLDKINRDTDQHTLQKLNDDVSTLIGTLNDSYLRNIRRVIERVNKVVGQPSNSLQSSDKVVEQQKQLKPAIVLHQSDDRLDGDPHGKLPGFPGWDELIVAVDRMQKSLASFVRSSTRLVTSGK